MISFELLGMKGRLGNQLFQYAFLRTTALRLGVQFYCPRWIGDEIFDLRDESIKANEPAGITETYVEPSYCGFNESAMKIGDGTNIEGYFQTQKYFDSEQVREWYTFRQEKIITILEKYRHISFSESVGCHLRFGDNITNPWNRVLFYLIPNRYYIQALSKVRCEQSILIFSDDIILAKKQLGNIDGNFIYIEGNKPYEDLYLMSLCRNFICSISTLSWWAAWLNSYWDKMIVVPKEGFSRPWGIVKNNDLWDEAWVKVSALRPLIDSFPVTYTLYQLGILQKMKPKIGLSSY